MHRPLPTLMALLVGALPAASQGVDIQQAIRAAWAHSPSLASGQAMVEQAQEQVGAAKAGYLPSLSATAGWTSTNEPMNAFGMKLNQSLITAADFDPARLNHPAAISGFGSSISVQQPLYVGGQLDAAKAVAGAQAEASSATQARRRQEIAAAVVQAYFGTEAGMAGVAYAEEDLKQAQATEAFVQSRVAQGLLLRSDLLRARAHRAQLEAALAEARQQEAEARSALSSLTGLPESVELTTPLTDPSSVTAGEGPRGDLVAAKFQAEAAASMVRSATGAWKPQVGLQVGWGEARPTFNEPGGNWTNVSVGLRWNFSFGTQHQVQAARAGQRAAEEAYRSQQIRAANEVQSAKRAQVTAQLRLTASGFAVEAAEEAYRLRQARHQEGMLPLTDLLDAQSALAGARALKMQSELETRIAAARLALATGAPLEGVTP